MRYKKTISGHVEQNDSIVPMVLGCIPMQEREHTEHIQSFCIVVDRNCTMTVFSDSDKLKVGTFELGKNESNNIDIPFVKDIIFDRTVNFAIAYNY